MIPASMVERLHVCVFQVKPPAVEEAVNYDKVASRLACFWQGFRSYQRVANGVFKRCFFREARLLGDEFPRGKAPKLP